MTTMTKQPKPWVESMLVAYVDNQLEPAQMAAVEEVIREDPEARTIVGVLRRSADAVKTAFDRPLGESVPARLLAAAGAADGQAGGGTVLPFAARKLRLNRSAITALAASLAALAIGFGAGSWQAAPAGRIYLAGSSATTEGPDGGQYEAALYQALEGSNPGVEVVYIDAVDDRRGAVTVVGPVAAGVGGNCLEFRHIWSHAGNKVLSRGLACRSDAGDWSVLSMPPKPAS
jgi:surface antigen